MAVSYISINGQKLAFVVDAMSITGDKDIRFKTLASREAGPKPIWIYSRRVEKWILYYLKNEKSRHLGRLLHHARIVI